MSSETRSASRLGVIPALVSSFIAGSIMAHAQTTPPANPATPPAASTPAAMAATPAPPPAITFSALLDGYYAYNFNKPKTASGAPGLNGPDLGTGRNFDSADNSFSLGLAEIGLTRAVSDNSRLGFTMKVVYGPTVSALTSSTDGNNLNVLQAYGTYLIPLKGKDLTVDAGKFVTHMGYEVIEPELNWNYSRSDLFQIFVPYYHSGIRAALPFGPTFTATGYIYNGWNNASSDNNVGKAYGFELAFTPSPKWSLILNGLASSEPTPAASVDTSDDEGATVNRAKNVLEPILTYNFSPAFAAVIDANFDFGKGASAAKPFDNNATWNATGVAGYLRYTLKSGSALTLRAETFDDKDGFLTGTNDLKGSEFTLTYGIKSPLFPGAETRFEYRYDTAKDAAGDSDFFASANGFGKKSQNTLSISENLSF